MKEKIIDWDSTLGELWNSSDLYNKLLEGSEEDFVNHYKDGQKIYSSVFALRLMSVTQCYVLLLAILRNHDKVGTNIIKIFQLIEKFSFQYSVVCKGPGNLLEKVYSKIAIRIENAVNDELPKNIPGKIQSIFSELEKKIKELQPSKDYFVESFINNLSYKKSDQGRFLVTYILMKIDSFYRKTNESKINFYEINIEHILPQNPSKEWQLTTNDIKPYVNKLGNLTLICEALNREAQNKIISKKLPYYERSDLPINKKLLKDIGSNGNIWNADEIEKRQKEFAEILYEVTKL